VAEAIGTTTLLGPGMMHRDRTEACINFNNIESSMTKKRSSLPIVAGSQMFRSDSQHAVSRTSAPKALLNTFVT